MIIGICGHIGAGKSLSAKILASVGDLRRLSFAAPLKDAVSKLFSVDRELLEGDANREWREQVDPRWGITPRQMLERAGEAMRREFGEMVFVKSWEARGVQNTVTDDVRHTSEIDRLRQLGAMLIWVRRETAKPSWEQMAIDRPELMPSYEPHVHTTRWEWLQHTRDMIVVDNNGTVPQLQESLMIAISKARKSREA